MANGHGGKRPGAGRPKKPLADKILDDSVRKHKAKVLDFHGEMPEITAPDFLSGMNSSINNVPTIQDVFKQTADWLQKTGCLNLVNPDLITNYSIAKARWYEAEKMISSTAFFFKDPATGRPITNPLVDVAATYFKQSDTAWDKIWVIVAQNCETDFGGNNPHTDLMEKLIKMNMEG